MEFYVKLVFESYVFRNAEGKGEFRTDDRKLAVEKYNTLVDYYNHLHIVPNFTSITTERALVDCKVVSKCYPKNSRFGKKAGKTFYRVYVDDYFATELDFKPKPLTIINAFALNLDWKEVE